jgi:hypothetical protein
VGRLAGRKYRDDASCAVNQLEIRDQIAQLLDRRAFKEILALDHDEGIEFVRREASGHLFEGLELWRFGSKQLAQRIIDLDTRQPYCVMVAARRTLHLRFNDLSDPQVPRDTDYASVFDPMCRSSCSTRGWSPATPRSRCCRRSTIPRADNRQGNDPMGTLISSNLLQT